MKSFFVFLIAIAFTIIGVSLGLMLGFTSKNYVSNDNTPLTAIYDNRNVNINVPAVDQNGKGVATGVRVAITNGTGRALVDINHIIFWGDTQESIQIAKDVAARIAKVNTSNIDITYSIQSQAALIEGQSAGTALTLATIAAFENKSINKSIMLTGTINSDGNVGEVGGISEKANASKSIGATLFLVPKGQSVIKQTLPVKSCTDILSYHYCRIKFVENVTKIQDIVGIEIKEVSNINEVLNYFDIRV